MVVLGYISFSIKIMLLGCWQKENKQNNNNNNNNEKEEEKGKKGTRVSEKKIVFRENIYYKLNSFPAKRNVCL